MLVLGLQQMFTAVSGLAKLGIILVLLNAIGTVVASVAFQAEDTEIEGTADLEDDPATIIFRARVAVTVIQLVITLCLAQILSKLNRIPHWRILIGGVGVCNVAALVLLFLLREQSYGTATFANLIVGFCVFGYWKLNTVVVMMRVHLPEIIATMGPQEYVLLDPTPGPKPCPRPPRPVPEGIPKGVDFAAPS
mmetsp:Transcript_21103/g.49380  ORF Transcript_21103/g.49380 Transcript_21103/m.49380 type:complete len:193 (+) Transcript_21103:76-654(+)